MFQLQKKFGIVGCTLGLVILSSCGKDSQPVASLNQEQGAAWVVKFSAACNAVSQAQCVGGFGFSVDANSRYKVGPGPGGEGVTGSVSKELFEPLAKPLNDALSSHSGASAEQCAPRAASEFSNVSIELKVGAAEAQPLVRLTASEICRSQIDADAANRLFDALRKVALNYYPVPFPDDNCDSARSRLENLYSDARKCKVAADCGYVDESFSLIPDTAVKIIATGDCSGVPMLVAGNRDWVRTRGSELVEALKSAQLSCKKHQVTASCTGMSEFKVTQPLPKCDAGFCKADSAAL